MIKGKVIRILMVGYMVLLMTLNVGTYILAADSGSEEEDDDFFIKANEWYSQGSTNTYLDAGVMSQLMTMIEVVGTGVIAIATVVLGIRYMLGSVSEKSQAKEGLITLLVACIFFFGWSNLRGILIKGVTFDDNGNVTNIGGASTAFFFEGATTLENAFSVIFAIVLFLAKAIALVVSIYMGVKYIFSGAEEKAKFKERSINYIIGIIFIFLTLEILSFISSSVNNALTGGN